MVKIWHYQTSVRKGVAFQRIDMTQRTAVLICLACLLMAGKAVGAESSDGIAFMRMHLECGWLEQLSGDREQLTEAAEYHIVAGAELSADLGLERHELADEVGDGSRRVLEGNSEEVYLGQKLAECRGMRQGVTD